MPDPLVQRVVERLAALADPTRVRILHHLQCLGEGAHADISALVAATGSGQASVSKHVAVLRSAGWVETRKAGTRVLVSVKDPAVYELCRIVCDGILRQAKELHLGLGLESAPTENT